MNATRYISKNNPDQFVDAVQLVDGFDWQEAADWCGGTLVNTRDISDEYVTSLRLARDADHAEETDWVCKLPSGEFTVWMDMEFASLYRPAEEATR